MKCIGLALTKIFFMLAPGFLSHFFVIALLVFSGITQSFDSKLAEIINTFGGSAFTSFMAGASQYGREYFWTLVVGIMLLFGNRNTKLLAVELAVLLVIGIIAGEIAKNVAFRERPYVALGASITLRAPPDTDSSFPSGHALIVSIGAFFALIKFRQGFKSRAIAILLLCEAAIVCYSRVYLGVHYPLDVLAGILFGGAIVYAGIPIIEGFLPRIFLKVARAVELLMEKLHLPELL